jgi:hypothetical protein
MVSITCSLWHLVPLLVLKLEALCTALKGVPSESSLACGRHIHLLQLLAYQSQCLKSLVHCLAELTHQCLKFLFFHLCRRPGQLFESLFRRRPGQLFEFVFCRRVQVLFCLRWYWVFWSAVEFLVKFISTALGSPISKGVCVCVTVVRPSMYISNLVFVLPPNSIYIYIYHPWR